MWDFLHFDRYLATVATSSRWFESSFRTWCCWPSLVHRIDLLTWQPLNQWQLSTSFKWPETDLVRRTDSVPTLLLQVASFSVLIQLSVCLFVAQTGSRSSAWQCWTALRRKILISAKSSASSSTRRSRCVAFLHARRHVTFHSDWLCPASVFSISTLTVQRLNEGRLTEVRLCSPVALWPPSLPSCWSWTTCLTSVCLSRCGQGDPVSETADGQHPAEPHQAGLARPLPHAGAVQVPELVLFLFFFFQRPGLMLAVNVWLLFTFGWLFNARFGSLKVMVKCQNQKLKTAKNLSNYKNGSHSLKWTVWFRVWASTVCTSLSFSCSSSSKLALGFLHCSQLPVCFGQIKPLRFLKEHLKKKKKHFPENVRMGWLANWQEETLSVSVWHPAANCFTTFSNRLARRSKCSSVSAVFVLFCWSGWRGCCFSNYSNYYCVFLVPSGFTTVEQTAQQLPTTL